MAGEEMKLQIYSFPSQLYRTISSSHNLQSSLHSHAINILEKQKHSHIYRNKDKLSLGEKYSAFKKKERQTNRQIEIQTNGQSDE